VSLSIQPFAFDDGFREAARRSGTAALRVHVPAATLVVLGAGSQPEIELHAGACAADGVPVLRRPGGGCAVVLDPGNVIVSIAYPAPGFARNREHFDGISAFLLRALRDLGFPKGHVEGVSDLAVGDRKFAGACLHRSRDLLYYSASLLVDPDMALIERYLRHPPREPEYRRSRPHADFLRPLRNYVPGSTAGRVAERLAAALNPAGLIR
jgi:lipoate---protein ligase